MHTFVRTVDFSPLSLASIRMAYTHPEFKLVNREPKFIIAISTEMITDISCMCGSTESTICEFIINIIDNTVHDFSVMGLYLRINPRSVEIFM